jgi:hypothetical protein
MGVKLGLLTPKEKYRSTLFEKSAEKNIWTEERSERG